MEQTKKQKKILLTLTTINVILLMSLILSFIPWKKSFAEKSSQSAILNVNKITDVSKIVLSQKNGDEENFIKLKKIGSFWIGTDSFTNTMWPADNQAVATFIGKCSQISSIHTVASEKKSWSFFAVDEDSAISLGFFDYNGEPISEVFFGATDSLKSRISFRTKKSQNIFQMDASIASYLNFSTSLWVDPFVFPQALTGYSRLQSESILRHGALTNYNPKDKTPYVNFRKDFENASSARFQIFKMEDNENLYTIVPRFIPGISVSDEEKKVIESFNYAYTMSQWTLEKFSEEVQQW